MMLNWNKAFTINQRVSPSEFDTEDAIEKTRFASRSEAGRYAANIRWMGHISEKVKLAFRVVKPKSEQLSDLEDANSQETQQILDAGFGGGDKPLAAWKEVAMYQIVAAMDVMNPNDERYQRIIDKLDAMMCFSYATWGDTLLEKCVYSLINSWAITSNDHNPLALATQDIAKEMFGLTESDEWTLDPRKWTPEGLQQIMDRTDIIVNDPDISTLIRDVLQAQYQLTQKYFAEKGITEIEVFRGVELVAETQRIYPVVTETLHNLPDGVPEATSEEVNDVLREIYDGNYRVNASTRPLSSWTLSRDTAKDFADGRYGVVMRATIPVKDIFSIPQTGFGELREKEVVILGTSARMVDYHLANRDPLGVKRDFDFTDENQMRELALEIFFENRRRFGAK
jgi:hypothetical protein